MQHDREAEPGEEAAQGGLAALVERRHAEDREDGGRPAVHHGGAEAAHDPRPGARIRREVQVQEVLDHRESRADREPEDRGIDQESDPVCTHQQRDDQCLEELLDDGGSVAREGRELDRAGAKELAIDEIGRPGRQRARADHQHDGAQLHELVAVQEQQGGQEAEHRQQAEPGAK